MNRGNFFRRAFSILFAISIMTFAAVSHAEIYIGEGSYCMSEGENLGVAKERAKADAMRNACEQAGVYVKSYTRTKNLMLEEDVIETMTANIIKLVEEPHFKMLEEVDNLEGIMIRVTVKAQIDDSDIMRWLNNDSNQISDMVSQMETLRKANQEQERQITELKRQLSFNPYDREKIIKKFENEDKIFLSNQKVEEATKLWEKKDFIGVISLCNEALDLNPNNELAYSRRGTAYMDGLKKYEQAMQDFNNAIKLNPKFDKAYYNRGVAYFDLGQYELAIKDYNKTIELNSDDFEAYNNRGVAYRGLKQYELAIKDYDKAIELNPNFDLAYNNRGNAYGIQGQYERAIQDFNKAIELNPNLADAYYNRGNAYGIQGQKERAIQDYNKAIELNPNLADAYYNRGNAYGIQGQYERAIQDFNKTIELNPNYADAYTNRGLVYMYGLKQYEKALKSFDKALEINPNHTKAKNNRKDCLKKLGR